MRSTVASCVAALALGAGCTGSIGDETAIPTTTGTERGAAGAPRPAAPGEPIPAGGAPPAAPPITPLAPPAGTLTAGPMPVRALTEREYRNTVRDLLGVEPNGVDLPLDERSRWGFAEA